jgi:DNA-binding response OmpR family regulator
VWLNPAKVLVVDDEEDWLTAAVELLRRAGYAVRGATSFKAAQQVLESFEPDLLITDVRLREYNGLYLLVRYHGDHPRMACLVVSGFDDPVLARDARQQGAFDFLVKPINPEDLLSKAAEALASRSKRRWPRKSLQGEEMPATIAGQMVRVIDVSYGGIRLHVPPGVAIKDRLELDIPTLGTRVQATPVWTNGPADASFRTCGATLQLDASVVAAWHAVVDRLAAPV